LAKSVQVSLSLTSLFIRIVQPADTRGEAL
jgi:hypothetical protein